MTGDPDDALRWEGDEDPTVSVGTTGETSGPAPARRRRTHAAPAAPPDAITAAAASRHMVASPDGTSAPPDDAAPPYGPTGNAALLALGVLGGVYVLYTVGWVVGGLRLAGAAQYLVSDVMFEGSLWLAILAPTTWFVAVLTLTRRSRAWMRFAWLAAGVVLLVPWPFIMVPAVGR